MEIRALIITIMNLRILRHYQSLPYYVYIPNKNKSNKILKTLKDEHYRLQ